MASLAGVAVSTIHRSERALFGRARCDHCGGEFGPLPVRVHSSGECGSFCSGECGREFRAGGSDR